MPSRRALLRENRAYTTLTSSTTKSHITVQGAPPIRHFSPKWKASKINPGTKEPRKEEYNGEELLQQTFKRPFHWNFIVKNPSITKNHCQGCPVYRLCNIDHIKMPQEFQIISKPSFRKNEELTNLVSADVAKRDIPDLLNNFKWKRYKVHFSVGIKLNDSRPAVSTFDTGWDGI